METGYIQYSKAEKLGFERVLLTDSTRSYKNHNHISVYTIGLILSGAVHLRVNSKEYICSAGDTFVIRPYEPHSITCEKKYSMICFCINKKIVRSEEPETLKRHFNIILGDKSTLLTDVQKVKLENVIVALKSTPQWNFERKSYINAIKSYIEQHPEKNMSVEKMSRKIYMSKYYFIHDFKKEVGLTPHQFMLQNRIRLAKRIMSDLTETEVALTTGFCDQSHFIKQFEKVVGLSPRGYKNSCETFQADKD